MNYSKNTQKKHPLKVEYSLTDLGKTLILLIQSNTDWGVFVVEEKGEIVV
ncbi:winged helix-turn-helix transcriptional regulator [Flavobacteriaceae bacterium LMO-SS05]